MYPSGTGLSGYCSYSGQVIAHELGHQLLGVGDSYREDIKWPSGCGMGENFNATPAEVDRPFSNSIMEEELDQCRLESDGRKMSEINPRWSDSCTDGCSSCTATNLGCPMAGSASCKDQPTLASEMNVASNFDPCSATPTPARRPGPPPTCW